MLKKNPLKLTLLFISTLFVITSCSESNNDPIKGIGTTKTCSAKIEDANPTGNNDVLIWAEEFNVDGYACSRNWVYEEGNGEWGWGNGEKQFYKRKNGIVKDGVLKISAKREDFNEFKYTSARLKTQNKFKFTYGKIEARAKLPASSGTWPAIWMLGDNISSIGWPACGEIDIMEQKGWDKNRILGTCHWRGSSNGDRAMHSLSKNVSNTDTEFHIYGVEWSRNQIKMFVDGEKYYTLNLLNYMPFDSDFFIILNVAVGGTLGGNIDPNLDDSMEVDWIRVYQ